jgi:glycosyltransferase involved in cell wall biosynthesis
MRIFVHDYCGHPFQIELSRWLAREGHQVCHCYSQDIESPRGEMSRVTPGLAVEALSQGRPVPKYKLVQRSFEERRYGTLAAARVRAFQADIVLSGNAPPAIQSALQHSVHKNGGAFVYWLQDIVSAVLDRVLPQRLPLAGRAIAARFRAYEYGVMKRSDAIVAISEDFVERCVRQGVGKEKILVQHNWAPLAEIVPVPRNNAWARKHGLADKFVFLFSGTLGLKHNPGLLSQLAESLRERDDVVVAVVSQGLGRQWLEEEAASRNLRNLKLFDFQPFDQLSNVLGSADVLTAILEPFAGELSVPSKILSYLCAERALLAALPAENLASRIVRGSGAGKIVSPSDADGFIAAAKSFIDEPGQLSKCATAGRVYAEDNFDIDRIGNRFLELFRGLDTGRRLRC